MSGVIVNSDGEVATNVKPSAWKSTVETAADRVAGSLRAKQQRISDALRARMSPAGALGLPELLDKRRLEHGLIDDCFKKACLFERVFVYQIPDNELETVSEGSLIIRPESVRDREKREACRGIIVSAGLSALDILRSNGADLGHIVTFVALAPWRILVGNVEGMDVELKVMIAGDMVASEDLMTDLREGKKSVVPFPVDGGGIEHRLAGGKLGAVKTKGPWIADEY